MVRGGRPADFPAAGLGDGQMLECNRNLDGVDVVVASCIYTSKGKESYASDLNYMQTSSLVHKTHAAEHCS